MEFSLAWNRLGVVVTIAGKVDFASMNRMASKVYGDIRFEKAHFVMIDFRGIDQVEMDEIDLKGIAAMSLVANRYSREGLKLAFVVADEAMERFMQTHIDTRTEGTWERKVFLSFDAAKAWASQGLK